MPDCGIKARAGQFTDFLGDLLPFLLMLERMRVEDLAAGLVRFANGAALFLEASWASHTDRERGYCTLLGTKSGIEIDLYPVADRKVFSMYTEKEGDWYDITFPQYERIDWRPVLCDQLLYFAACIRRGKENMANAEEGLDVMRMLCALYESAETGREVRLEG